MLCTCGFVDDTIFSNNNNGPYDTYSMYSYLASGGITPKTSASIPLYCYSTIKKNQVLIVRCATEAKVAIYMHT